MPAAQTYAHLVRDLCRPDTVFLVWSDLLCGDAGQRKREREMVAHKDAYSEPAKGSMRVLCICILAGIQPRRAAAVVLPLLSRYCVWQ